MADYIAHEAGSQRMADTVRRALLLGDRGRLVSSPRAERVVATVHPSSILRAPDASRRVEMRAFVRNLKGVAKLIR